LFFGSNFRYMYFMDTCIQNELCIRMLSFPFFISVMISSFTAESLVIGFMRQIGFVAICVGGTVLFLSLGTPVLNVMISAFPTVSPSELNISQL